MSESANYDVSIIVVSWNVCDLLADCLQSISDRCQKLKFQLIVVDNCSRDDSVAMVRQKFPEVEVVALDSNIGFAAANNVGIRRARGRTVLLLNPDTVILDDAIGNSIRWLEAHPDVGVLGCQILENESTIQQTCFDHPSLLNLLLDVTGVTSRFRNQRILGRSVLGGWDRRSQRDVPVVSGMFMLMPHQALDDVGLLDDQFFVYAEEADLCRRFWSKGWRCVFAPVGQVLHRDGGGKSSDQTSVAMYVQLQKSLLLYLAKYHGILGWFGGWLIYVTSMAMRVGIHGVLSFVRPGASTLHRLKQSWTALKFHLWGIDPCPSPSRAART